MSVFEPVISDKENPLVSILVYNYNYGRYLEECLESLVAQTYKNIEINFSDNASTDDSWEVALKFANKYPGHMTLTKNRKNFGSDANFNNCLVNKRGKYFINMCSDDVLLPGFIERCVNVLESDSEIGYVMVHRDIIDAESNREEEPPFYNQSCVIPGHEQAAVYMVAAVNPSVSQIMYSSKHIIGKTATGGFASRWYGTRILDFNLCSEYSMAYIKEPLMQHRLHGLNDSLVAADGLLEVIGAYVLHLQFAEIAEPLGMDKVVKRLPASIEKLSKLCLRYCIRSLLKGNPSNAKKYFHLSLVLNENIENDDDFLKLQSYWLADEGERSQVLKSLNEADGLITRTVSYDPPEGSIPL